MKHTPHNDLGQNWEWGRPLSQVCRKFQGVVVKYRGNFASIVLCDWIAWLNKVSIKKMIIFFMFTTKLDIQHFFSDERDYLWLGLQLEGEEGDLTFAPLLF
jgi:hypothetical protein